MKKHLPLLVFILSIYNLSAQNLIVNGDFESGGNGVGFITDGAGYSELLAPFQVNSFRKFCFSYQSNIS
ncbi:MAG: hypothetical protein IPO23_10480 [Flavobacterium sp.]|nr:hypothetical protein [Flavobacterium sp.]